MLNDGYDSVIQSKFHKRYSSYANSARNNSVNKKKESQRNNSHMPRLNMSPENNTVDKPTQIKPNTVANCTRKKPSWAMGEQIGLNKKRKTIAQDVSSLKIQYMRTEEQHIVEKRANLTRMNTNQTTNIKKSESVKPDLKLLSDKENEICYIKNEKEFNDYMYSKRSLGG